MHSSNQVILGVNVPWWGRSYGHDIGPNQRYPSWAVWYNRDLVDRYVDWLCQCGVGCIRIWLFENGEGLVYDQNGLITGLHPVFMKNLDHLVTATRRVGLKVYWTLLDANSCFRNGDTITYSILSNPDRMDVFVRTVLPMLMPILSRNSWAIDLCNEPEAVVTGNSGNWTTSGLSWPQIGATLEILANGLRHFMPEHPIAVGSGWHECQNVRSGVYDRLAVRLSFLDFHAQRLDAYVSGRAAGPSGNGMVVVGELGVGGDPASPVSREEWRVAQSVLANKLETAVQGEYAAIFLWYGSGSKDRDRGGLVYGEEGSPALHYLARMTGGRVDACPI